MLKITRKLTLTGNAACLATILIMSSCSKENAQIPTPQVLSANEGSNLKFIQGAYIPTISRTIAGLDVLPSGWSRIITYLPDNLTWRPVGTSTLTHLWGNSLSPWIKPLQAPYQNSGDKIITFIDQRNTITSNNTASEVSTKIKNLIPGSKYSVTFYTAATIRDFNGQPSQYPDGGVRFGIEGKVNNVFTYSNVDLTGKEAEWVKKTIEFVAQTSEADVNISSYRNGPTFGAEVVNAKYLNYFHIFVGADAVQHVN